MTLPAILITLAASLHPQPQPPAPAPQQPPAPAAAPAADQAPALLPTQWHGMWRGKATNTPAGARPAIEFSMQLRIAPTAAPDRLSWEITYEGGGTGPTAARQVRPYELLAVDAAAGRFAIDEKNGIVIDAGLAGGRTLSSHFEVQNVMITASYRLELGAEQSAPSPSVGARRVPDRIVVELHTFLVDEPRSSGGGNTPPVKSWRLASIQRAELERVP